MSIVINFRGYRPSAREDGVKWIAAHAQEAPDIDGEPGTWTEIDLFVIDDYADPAVPPYLNFTTSNATQSPGWYRVRFTDAGLGSELTAPQFYSNVVYRPTTRDVAVHIKNRTVDSNNNFLGDFSNATAVSAEEVNTLILKGEQRVLRRLDLDPNEPIPTESAAAIKDLISLYAAMLVELTKYSEQVARGTSPYPQLKALFDEQLLEVREDVTGVVVDPGGGGGSTVTGSLTAHYAFPDVGPGTITWDTRF